MLGQALHKNPELAGDEFNTSKLIRNNLKNCNLTLHEPFLGTDVTATLKGGKKGRNIVLRADMDALPLLEENEISYKSKISGKMHACGHDGHVAILLGAAQVLNELRGELQGNVRFVFQPGEEVAAMGQDLVNAGALEAEGFIPDVVFAIHGMPDYPVGSIVSRSDAIMAAADFFKIKIFGSGGHGSKPELTIDPLLTACRAVEAMQSIISRNLNPQDATVISVCHIKSGSNQNIIPETAFIEGTTRYLEPDMGGR